MNPTSLFKKSQTKRKTYVCVVGGGGSVVVVEGSVGFLVECVCGRCLGCLLLCCLSVSGLVLVFPSVSVSVSVTDSG